MLRGKDLTGMKFGRLRVLEQAEGRKNNCKLWLCKCECGNSIITTTNHLTTGDTKSCGCLVKEKSRINSLNAAKHGKRNTRLYKIWSGMKSRCYNPNSTHHNFYDNIQVCSEWKDNFEAFDKWAINNGYKECLTLDRIDGNKDYEPGNCRWITMNAQNRNRKSNIKIEYRGKEYILADLATVVNVSAWTLYKRYKRGLRGEELIKPAKK